MISLLILVLMPFLLLIVVGQKGWEFLLNLKRTTLICYWSAVACGIISLFLIACSIYIEHGNQCSEKLLAKYPNLGPGGVRLVALFASIFVVVAFASVQKESSQSAYSNILKQSQFQEVRFFIRGIVITDAHLIIFVPLYGFLVLALAIPLALLAFVRDLAVSCGSI
jgi:hypothetical protein